MSEPTTTQKMATVVLLGSCDTKLDELLFLRSQIRRHQPSPSVVFIDAGRSPVSHPAITISQPDLIARYGTPSPATSPSDLPRGDLIKHMSACATRAVRELHSSGAVSGLIAAGGTGNTSLAAAVMRDALPIGVPKLIVSTVASGDPGPLVRETDIALLYSVVVGIPSCGGFSLFGVPRPGAVAARALLVSRGGDVETRVFLATGHGGLA